MKFIRWVLTFFLVALALPAQAHDQLIDQSPKAGAVLEAGVIELRLSFNNELLNLGDSTAQILVLNQAGEPQNPGCALIEGRDASVKLSLDEKGEYSVAWRVVSSDGHPISGEYGFSLENSSGFEADPSFSFIDCPEQIVISAPASQGFSWYFLLWVSLGLGALLLLLWLRPRPRKS